METITVHYKDGTAHDKLVVDPNKDQCPLCDTPLSSVGFSWNIMHGEGSASCCGAPYQLKSYYVDEHVCGKEAKDFAESLDAPDRIQCKIDGKYLDAYRKAFAELGIRRVGYKKVHDLVGKILGEE